MMPLSTTELARLFGRSCREVFAHDEWATCEDQIAANWRAVGEGVAWEEAKLDVQQGWFEHESDADVRSGVPPVQSPSRF